VNDIDTDAERLAAMRADYQRARLRREDLSADPIAQFEPWLGDAVQAQIIDRLHSKHRRTHDQQAAREIALEMAQVTYRVLFDEPPHVRFGGWRKCKSGHKCGQERAEKTSFDLGESGRLHSSVTIPRSAHGH